MRGARQVGVLTLARLLLGALLWLSLAAAGAGEFDHGLLWRIEKGGRVSHLLGTMHSNDARVTAVLTRVEPLLAQTRTVVLEVVPDAAQLAQAQRIFNTDGRTLSAIVGPRLFAETARRYRAKGVPEALLERFKPWAAAVTLLYPTDGEGAVLDMRLYATARERGLATAGLESAAEQMGIFEALDDREQTALLADTLQLLADPADPVERMTRCYVARDLAGLARLAQEHAGSDPQLNDELDRTLVSERNRRMAQRMQPLLERGGALVAVGALHLAGEEGILALLRAAGWRLSRLY